MRGSTGEILEVLSDAGVNWVDVERLSNVGINWLDVERVK